MNSSAFPNNDRHSDFDTTNPNGQILVTYIWLGGSGSDLRGKTRVIQGPITNVSQLPEWNYDGSSTGQASTNSSEVVLRPRRMCRDPFRKGDHLIVFCDNWNPDGTPAMGNFRHIAEKVFAKADKEEPWFGIEQEYIMYQVESVNMKYPIGWGKHGYNAPQG